MEYGPVSYFSNLRLVKDFRKYDESQDSKMSTTSRDHQGRGE